MINQELIVVKQLPIIEEKLKTLSEEIDGKVKNAMSLICNEETVKTVKQVRSDLNKDFRELESQRKAIKEQVLSPYMKFEEVYKEYVSDKFKSADADLKNKIDNTEKELKDKKEQEIKEYFDEYKLSKNIDFITYEQAKINVTLTASKKSLKEQVETFINKVADDLNLIETQDHKPEILVEYKQSLNVSQAITTVANRFKAIEEEKKKQEQEKELQNFIVDIAKESDKYVENQEMLQAPVEEKTHKVTFTVTDTAIRLKKLKDFLIKEGYQYE